MGIRYESDRKRSPSWPFVLGMSLLFTTALHIGAGKLPDPNKTTNQTQQTKVSTR